MRGRLESPRALPAPTPFAALLLGAMLSTACGGGGDDTLVAVRLQGTTMSPVAAAAANTSPVADAGPDQQVVAGARVRLQGGGSSDADGNPLTYSWRLLSRPCGSTATLTAPGTARPAFTADREGRYVARLIVSDGITSSVADRVVVLASSVTAGLPPPAQQAYLKTCNPSPADQFSAPIVMSGNTLVVGAPFKYAHGGAVYVFTRQGGFWNQQAELRASNAASGGDEFGSSVALHGDTLVVGAHFEDSNAKGVNGNQADNSANGSGAVYVFTRTNSVWTQQAYLKASNTEAIDLFGSSVALYGDTLAVGAQAEDSDATGSNGNQSNNRAGGSGAVYVFTRSNGTWRQQAYLKASNTGANDGFGTSLALYGSTLAVGAIREASSANGVNGDQTSNNASAAGAVYVFTRSAGVWSQQAYLKASNTLVNGSLQPVQWFGASLALGADTLAVGTPLEWSGAVGINGNQANANAPDSGAVYLFTRTAGVWRQQAYIKASNTGTQDYFGNSVALSGNRLAVGALFEDSRATGFGGNQADNGALDSGAAYVFSRSGTVWSQQAYVKASNTGAGDRFGHVALSGNTLAVGADGEDSNSTGVNGNPGDNSASSSGAAYVFTLP